MICIFNNTTLNITDNTKITDSGLMNLKNLQDLTLRGYSILNFL